MGTMNLRKKAHLKRKKRVRKNIYGTNERPRLSVFRSAKHMYAQIIDDTCGHTLTAVSSLEKVVKDHLISNSGKESDLNKGKIALAKYIGNLLAERAIEKGIEKVVFDRNGFLYHGRVKAVSDGAREAGLIF